MGFDDVYFWGFQDRGAQLGHDGLIVMIRVVQCQHGGFFLRLTWNPRITLVCSSTVVRDE